MRIPIVSDVKDAISGLRLLGKLKAIWETRFDPNKKVRVVMPTGDTVEVEVKPSGKSTINWGALVAGAAALLTFAGIDVPESLQKEALALITLAVSIFIYIRRTYFTTKVTPQSAAKANGGTG